jgi:hypothetical protein
MVCTCTGDFIIDVPEGSGAHRGAEPTRPHGAASEAPPPPPLQTREHRAAASHTERTHVGADREPRALRRPLAAPLASVGVLLHWLPGDAPSDVHCGV